MDEITHKKIKVLWFSNVEYSENKPTPTGTWLHAMFMQLKLVPELVDICCCITFGNVTLWRTEYYISAKNVWVKRVIMSNTFCVL